MGEKHQIPPTYADDKVLKGCFGTRTRAMWTWPMVPFSITKFGIKNINIDTVSLYIAQIVFICYYLYNHFGFIFFKRMGDLVTWLIVLFYTILFKTIQFRGAIRLDIIYLSFFEGSGFPIYIICLIRNDTNCLWSL